MAVYKLSTEELEVLKELELQRQNIQYELGGLSLYEIDLRQQLEQVEVKKSSLTEKFKETITPNDITVKKLTSKYGKGVVNLEKGEYEYDENAQ
jgi:PIN domain nuclease of toxin-antitoxin system